MADQPIAPADEEWDQAGALVASTLVYAYPVIVAPETAADIGGGGGSGGTRSFGFVA